MDKTLYFVDCPYTITYLLFYFINLECIDDKI